jgi:hypothetical protein
MANQVFPTEREQPVKVAELLQDITHDVRRIAVDEIELARGKMTGYLEELVLKAAGAIVGACVALIGLGLLCLTVVAALEPVIHPLWLRLLIMAVVYLALGGAAAYLFVKRLMALHGPNLEHEKEEIGETVDSVKKGLAH